MATTGTARLELSGRAARGDAAGVLLRSPSAARGVKSRLWRRLLTKGIGVRFLVAFALVCLTWNPTRYNYVGWALARYKEMAPLVAFVGIVFVIAWIFFVRATMRSLGAVGLVLAGRARGDRAVDFVLLPFRRHREHRRS